MNGHVTRTYLYGIPPRHSNRRRHPLILNLLRRCRGNENFAKHEKPFYSSRKIDRRFFSNVGILLGTADTTWFISHHRSLTLWQTIFVRIFALATASLLQLSLIRRIYKPNFRDRIDPANQRLHLPEYTSLVFSRSSLALNMTRVAQAPYAKWSSFCSNLLNPNVFFCCC